MCGIAGVVDFGGRPLDPEELRAMADIQRHRGPDGEGAVLFRVGPGESAWWERDTTPLSHADAGFAHRRLAIIDLSPAGRQPMHDGAERVWVTFNGEIYNYRELMQELEGLGYRFRSRSDTEVILHAYREWGLACVDRFNGMFAFALWDVEHRRLFCARDRLGIKPFYYRLDGGRIAFASEIKALLAGMDGAPRVNPAVVADYLSFSFSPTDETFFDGVSKLPPGYRLVADPRGMKIEPYWLPAFEASAPADDASVLASLRELLDDAVRLQLRSDVPLGAHLSGGIDSSLVCCLAARHVPQLQTFTARFVEGGIYDESAWARQVAEAIRAEHHEIVPAGDDVRDVLPRILYHLDHPIEGAAVFGKFHVAEMVSRHVKVVLGGQGGDELFGGYDWYVKTLFTAACFGGGGAALGGRPAAAFVRDAWSHEGRARLLRALWSNAGRRDVGAIFRRSWRRLPERGERRFLRPELTASQPSSDERFAGAFARLPETDPVERMFHFDMRYYLDALLQSEDRLSMAFSVESRVPLLDHRIAELAGRLGATRKTVPGRSKDLLRRAASGIVPEAILARTDKRGFPTPVEAWLRDPRLGLLDRFVSGDSPFVRELFALDRVRAWAGRRVSVGTAWSETLWRILTVAAWGERFGVRV